MTDDAECEAELQARTPELWAELRARALIDEEAIVALQHLAWRQDVKGWAHVGELVTSEKLGDQDCALSLTAEIADRLRASRDNPEERERERWIKLAFAAAMIGSSKDGAEKIWLG